MEMLVNWLLPLSGGIVALWAAVLAGRVWECEQHECEPCGRKHKDDL